MGHRPATFLPGGAAVSESQCATPGHLNWMGLGCPQSPGRAGEKLAKLSAFCFDLFDASSHLDFEDISRFLNSLNNSFDAYSKPPESHNEFPAEPFASNAESDRDQPELVLPKVRVRGDTCVSLPVSASRIKWKLAPPSILALF